MLDVLQNVVLEQRFWYVWIGLELDHDLDEHVPVVLLDVVLEQRFWYFWIGLEKLDLKHVYHDINILDFIFCQTSLSTWSWPWWACACCPSRRRPRATILVFLNSPWKIGPKTCIIPYISWILLYVKLLHLIDHDLDEHVPVVPVDVVLEQRF